MGALPEVVSAPDHTSTDGVAGPHGASVLDGSSRDEVETSMRTICAWCQVELHAGSGAHPNEVSHGICEACRRRFEAALPDPEGLDGFLDRLEVPVLVVDDDVVVLAANRAAQATLRKDLSSLRGFRGGDVLECVSSRLPGGCGRQASCSACKVRNTVLATHRDGQSRHDVTALQQLVDPEGTVTRTRVRISADKAGAVVFLRIAEMEPEPTSG
jgi:hypothetical protein